MADHRRNPGVTDGVEQPQHVAHQVQHAKATEVAVIIRVPAGGAAIAALVGCDDVVARLGQRRHHLAPAIGQLRKAMQQQKAGPPRCLEARFQNVHAEPVAVLHQSRGDPRRQSGPVHRTNRVHGNPPRFPWTGYAVFSVSPSASSGVRESRAEHNYWRLQNPTPRDLRYRGRRRDAGGLCLAALGWTSGLHPRDHRTADGHSSAVTPNCRPPTPTFARAPDALPSSFGLTTLNSNRTLWRRASRPCRASTIQRTRNRPYASHRCVAQVRDGNFASRPFHAIPSACDLIRIAAQVGVTLMNAP